MQFSIPAEVQQFVRTYLRSLDQLEVLLLVSALPDREWTVDAVYQVVLSTPAMVQERLEGFVAAGLLTRTGDPPVYRYAPPSHELESQISGLGAAYRLARHKIVELIYPPAKDPMKDFSDAFRFKRDK